MGQRQVGHVSPFPLFFCHPFTRSYTVHCIPPIPPISPAFPDFPHFPHFPHFPPFPPISSHFPLFPPSFPIFIIQNPRFVSWRVRCRLLWEACGAWAEEA